MNVFAAAVAACGLVSLGGAMAVLAYDFRRPVYRGRHR